MDNCTYRNYNIAFVHLFLCFLAIAAFHCAGQVAPSGGPKDTIPPKIVETYPVTKAIGFHDNVIQLTFDKWMDKSSVNESIFLSPNLGDLDFDWSGKEINIKFTDTLRENTTYVLTLGTDARDLRAGNKLAESYSLAFSTGDHIDSASLSGKIFDEKPEGIMIFAYQLDQRNADTLNPERCKPDYLTQTGKDGKFFLPFLRIGTYRVFAVRDEYKNLLYDPETDEYGVPQAEFQLTPEHSSIQEINMRMTKQDTSAPFLSTSRAIDQQHVLLRFSEPIDTSSLRYETISIFDTLKHTQLTVIDASPGDTSLSEATILTGEQDSTKIYRIKVIGVRDLFGNAMPETSKTVDFDGSNTPDTTKPAVKLINILPDSKDVFPFDTIMIGLSEWVMRQKFQGGVALMDSGKNPVNGTLTFTNSTHALFIPQLPLQYNMPYMFKVALDSVIDIAGNRRSDSTTVIKFQTVDKDKLGAITGTFVDVTGTVKGKIFIFATPLEPKQDKKTQILDRPGNFEFTNLPEGKYVLSAFVDSDSNKTYSYGTYAPFHPSEQFIYYGDTLKVRARWTQEGVMIKLK